MSEHPGVPSTTDRKTAATVVRRIVPVVVASLLLVGGIGSSASAAPNLSSWGVSATVSGSTVRAAATISSSPAVGASKAGICARNSSGAVVDFPATRWVTIPESGRTFTSSRSFAAGTYRYWPCVLSGGVWTAAGSTRSFTVGAAVAPGAGSGSGASMPVGNLPGWTQVFAEDFTANLARGSFPGPYQGKWQSYDGFPDTSRQGDYDQGIISAQNGVLDLWLHSEDGRRKGAAPVPLVDGEWGGQTYGRFSVRMKSDAVPGFGVAFLLWPDSENWSDGEIDFPESGLGENVWGYNHCIGNPTANCYWLSSPARYTSWHTYTIDWTPSRITYLIDGAVVGSTTNSIPNKPMHWVMQTESRGAATAGAQGHLLIDWATIYTYTP